MSSNVDSDGYPIDHDGNRLEDGCVSSAAPFAVRGDVLHEILSGSGKETECNHVDSNFLEGSWVKASALGGGIPVADNVVVEDYFSSDEEPMSPRTAREACKSSTSATIQAVLRSSKHEREELFRARKKLMDVLKFLRFKGFSEEEIYKELYDSGNTKMSTKMPNRDDFGLPKDANKMKESICHKEEFPTHAHKVGDKFPPNVSNVSGPSGVKDNLGHEKSEKSGPQSSSQTKSWSQVVKEATPVAVNFDLTYVPPVDGESVICPPDEVLKEGNDKLKTSIVGRFTKGVVPYNKVVDFANKLWKNRGLISVGQKDNRTFLFKFNSISSMNLALAKGTWYIERRPLVVHAWGSSVSTVKTMPLWTRFDNIPDSYWNPQCLSRIASVIGPPLCSDSLTSRMEVMPFAKICVEYTIGNDLPSSIPVTTLDPLTGEKGIVEVHVSYPARPLVCTACKSLGHLVGACPKVTRKWVRKEKVDVNAGIIPSQTAALMADESKSSPLTGITANPEPLLKDATPAKRPPSPSGQDLSDTSATPLCTFRNLKKVDEIDMKKDVSTSSELGEFQLSRSQRKKLRKEGKSPIPPSL